MSLHVEEAHHLARQGFRILPLHTIRNGVCTCIAGSECDSPGKHPVPPKTGKNHSLASRDPAQLERWWLPMPDANVGIVTGQGLAVIDIDGVEGAATLKALVETLGPLPRTLQAQSGRVGGGRHLYYRISQELRPSAGSGLDLRADGGLVVAPPSMHASGQRYVWVEPRLPIADMPPEFEAWFATRKKRGPNKPRIQKSGPDSFRQNSDEISLSLGVRPPWLAVPTTPAVAVKRAPEPLPPWQDVAAAVAMIPNDDSIVIGWDDYSDFGMAIYASTGGSEIGKEILRRWALRSRLFEVKEKIDARWEHWHISPPTEVGFGTLVFMARLIEPGWEPPSRRKVLVDPHRDVTDTVTQAEQGVTDANGHSLALPQGLTQESGPTPLIRLNNQYAVIGDVGGKCLVLGWVPSKVDEALKVPSFQTFKSFSERYANQYILTKRESKDGEVVEEPKQIGSYWLKWTGRRSFEGIELEPLGPALLPGGVMNLWSGFAVDGAAGRWDLMKAHILQVLAGGDRAAADYIAKFAAWAVQHPGERAEVALVFRGGKGSGKGTFANALRRLFGQHGLQIFNSKHLVGSFNGHLRNCLLLFADEAFWAGDKQGESVLKGMLTESVLMIEQKGVDAMQWRNRLHVIMAANAEWVVPASHDERRYAVFDVSNERIGNRRYFQELHAELKAGGLAAMLHDLLLLPLGDWHPRDILHNEALRKQKERSLSPLQEWYLEILDNGKIPNSMKEAPHKVGARSLLADAQSFPRLRDVSPQALGRFLSGSGCEGMHLREGNFWDFGRLNERRAQWRRTFGEWPFLRVLEDWV